MKINLILFVYCYQLLLFLVVVKKGRTARKKEKSHFIVRVVIVIKANVDLARVGRISINQSNRQRLGHG